MDSEDSPEERPSELKGLEDEAVDAKDFYAYLKEAQSTDLTDIERTGCVVIGNDMKNNPVIVLIPVLGVNSGEKLDVSYRKMLLLFIRKANELVGTTYSVLYAHTNVDIINQYPLIYKFYAVLPRAYKKNLHKMYVIHPNVAIRMFFEFARVFLSHKFYSKLVLLESVLDFQRVIPPTQMQLPSKFLKKEDEIRGLKFHGTMAELADSFVASLGTSFLMHTCAQFLRENGGLQTKGLFRISGDEAEATLAKVRLQYGGRKSTAYTERITPSANRNSLLIGDLSLLTTRPLTLDRKPPADLRLKQGAAPSSATAGVLREEARPDESPNSVVVLSSVHTVAHLFKASIGTLARPLVSHECYTAMIDTTRRCEASGGLNQQWERNIATAIAQLPHEHISTLVYAIQFLREVSSESVLNAMDSSNLAIVFAPTLFRPDMIDPMKAVMEMKLSKTIIKEMIDRKGILQQAMHVYSDMQKEARASARASASGGRLFIFENPIREYANVLDAELAAKLNVSEVRDITDNFGAKLQSRMNAPAGRVCSDAGEERPTITERPSIFELPSLSELSPPPSLPTSPEQASSPSDDVEQIQPEFSREKA
ncbi:Rho GTPase activation protein [Ochromonadaceae sp. CCMP2298]|nr:Rho GTPase activation protein [Ochromonadaceae sp. CCMP2298]|mmetsp:Transcript_14312/g.31563  ORF Transcript_14312/g.31563 Transcript_14312/m.31563 type:complete len:596 (+) Transcript_14312:85-1872(+)